LWSLAIAQREGISMDTSMRRMPHRPPLRRTPHAGNSRQKYQRYIARAPEARLAGDTVEMENC
jgi:hypothetical protein